MGKPVKTDSEDDIAEALRGRIGYRRNLSAVAKQLGISKGHLSEILSGKKKVGRRIVAKLGYKPVARYEKETQ